MTDTAYRFRTALSGFHKGDVAGYIEKTAATHRAEILEHEKIIADLQEQNQVLQQEIQALRMTNAELEEKMAEVASNTEQVPHQTGAPQTVVMDDFSLLELQAYRRAEATERNANDRAKKFYQQLEQMRENALSEFEHTDNVVKETLDTIRSQAAVMEQAYGVLAETLDGSREALETMFVVKE